MNNGYFRRVLICALLLIALAAIADPENFISHDFNFIRPPQWKWVWDEKRSKKGNLLDVPGADANEPAPVYFWKFNEDQGSVDARTKAWQVYFREAREDLHVQSSSKKVGDFEVTYVEIQGTQVRAPHADYALIGAIIKLKDGCLAIRMSGRSPLIEKSKSTFKEMIEHALKEKQAD